MSGSKKNDYFGGGPFSGDYSDLAQSVMRIAEKTAKEETKEENKEAKGFENLSDDQITKKLSDTYLRDIRGGM